MRETIIAIAFIVSFDKPKQEEWVINDAAAERQIPILSSSSLVYNDKKVFSFLLLTF